MNHTEVEVSLPLSLQPLKCFQHCRKDVDLVCFSVPYICPLCKKCVGLTESRIPPYILPSPFTSSADCPRSVVLKPTQGNFITNYVQTCNLHIGVSDGNGFVYDFDEAGLKYGSLWPECLAVSFDRSIPDSIWDACLSKVVNDSGIWNTQRYHEVTWNCFDFVLHFMKYLSRQSECHEEFARMSKEEFTDLFLTKKTRRAEQYIHLFRQVVTSACVSVVKQNTSTS